MSSPGSSVIERRGILDFQDLIVIKCGYSVQNVGGREMTVKTGFSGGSGKLHMVKGRKTVCGKDVDGRTWDDPKVIVSCGSCRRTKAYKNAPHDVTDSGEKTVSIELTPEIEWLQNISGVGLDDWQIDYLKTMEEYNKARGRRDPAMMIAAVHRVHHGDTCKKGHTVKIDVKRCGALMFNKGDLVLTPNHGYVVITSAVPKAHGFLLNLETSAGELVFSPGFETKRIRMTFSD